MKYKPSTLKKKQYNQNAIILLFIGALLLFASVITNPDFFNYGTALIIIEDHMGVGVSGNEGVGGTYFEVPTSPHKFYYCETTGRGYAIGDMPEEYQGGSIKELIEISST